MAEKRIDIIIRARNEARAAFEQAARDAQALGASLKLGGDSGSGWGQIASTLNLIRGGGAAAAVAGVARALTEMSQAARGMVGDMASGKKNWADFIDAIVTKAPILKDIYALGREAVAWGPGENAEKRIRNAEAELKRVQQENIRNAIKVAGAERYVALAGEIRQQEQLAELSDRARQAEEIRLKFAEREAKLVEAAKIGGRQVADEDLAALGRGMHLALAEQRDKWAKEEQRERERVAAERKKQLDEERRFRLDTGDIEAELRVARLRAAGRDREAELEQIRHHYRRLRDAVRTGENDISQEARDERLRALRDREQQELAGVQQPAFAAQGGVASAVRAERYTGLAAAYRGDDPARRTADGVHDLVEQSRQQVALLKEIKQKGGGALGMGGLEGYLIHL